VDDVDVKEILLDFEQGGAEIPKQLGPGLEDGEGGFVGEGGGRVPGLDLVPEDDFEMGRERGVG
jgi:hypothetical protein